MLIPSAEKTKSALSRLTLFVQSQSQVTKMATPIFSILLLKIFN